MLPCHTRLALLAASTCLAAPGAAQETITLRFAPPQGQVTRYLTEMQVWGQSPMMPTTDTTVPMMVQRLWKTRTVTAVEGDVRTVQEVVDSAAMESPAMRAMMEQRGMGGMAGGMMAQQANMLRGRTTTERVDSHGKVISQETQAPNMPPMMQQQRMGQQEGGVGRGGMVFPTGAIRVGDTWTDSQMVAQQGGPGMGGGRGGRGGPGAPGGGGGGEPTMTTWRMTFRLERVESRGGMRVAVITMNGSIAGPGGGAGDVNGTLTGQIEADLTNSRMLSTVVNANMSTPQGAMRMAMTTTVQES